MQLARAQAQATAIIKAAQAAGQTIVRNATSKAHRQAGAIISQARKQARTIAASQPTAVPPVAAVVPTIAPVYVAPTAIPSSGQTPTTQPGAAASTPPNLRGLPASWLVVGYNATFGSGPGGVGGVSVVNRGGRAFSGVVSFSRWSRTPGVARKRHLVSYGSTPEPLLRLRFHPRCCSLACKPRGRRNQSSRVLRGVPTSMQLRSHWTTRRRPCR